MTTKRVEEIHEEYIEALPAVDRLHLVELVAHRLAATISQDAPHSRSLLKLEGLGKEVWQGVDPQA